MAKTFVLPGILNSIKPMTADMHDALTRAVERGGLDRDHGFAPATITALAMRDLLRLGWLTATPLGEQLVKAWDDLSPAFADTTVGMGYATKQTLAHVMLHAAPCVLCRAGEA